MGVVVSIVGCQVCGKRLQGLQDSDFSWLGDRGPLCDGCHMILSRILALEVRLGVVEHQLEEEK